MKPGTAKTTTEPSPTERRVVLVNGISGAGKTTLAKQLASRLEAALLRHRFLSLRHRELGKDSARV